MSCGGVPNGCRNSSRDGDGLPTGARASGQRTLERRKRHDAEVENTEFIHEGKYAAEVSVELIRTTPGRRTFSPEDVHKLDTVRLALRRGDIAEAAKYGRVFELTPVAAK